MLTGSHITRQKFVMMLVFFLWICMTVKIGMIQIVDHNQLHRSATNQRMRTVTLTGERGNIFDCNGVQLTMNLQSASYALRYKDIEDVVDVVHNLGISKKVAKLMPLVVVIG